VITGCPASPETAVGYGFLMRVWICRILSGEVEIAKECSLRMGNLSYVRRRFNSEDRCV